jgi:hypothetical protein
LAVGVVAALAYLLVPAVLLTHSLTSHATHVASAGHDEVVDNVCDHAHDNLPAPAEDASPEPAPDSQDCQTCLLIGTLIQSPGFVPLVATADGSLLQSSSVGVQAPAHPVTVRHAVPASPRAPPLL